jgi:hypothetical protein
MSPGSNFFQYIPLVTLVAGRDQLVVGPFDAAAACKEGQLFYSVLPAHSEAWRLPLQIGEGTDRHAMFDLAYTGSQFRAPSGIINRLKNKNEEPISLRFEGFELSLNSAVLGESELVKDPHNNYELPLEVLKHMIVQLDAANQRIGVCSLA